MVGRQAGVMTTEASTGSAVVDGGGSVSNKGQKNTKDWTTTTLPARLYTDLLPPGMRGVLYRKVAANSEGSKMTRGKSIKEEIDANC